MQIIFAGKAHPRDNPGKDLIRQIVHTARKEPFRQSLVFLEDYDMNVARYLVQGVDVWLNTPLRPMEACGTSGMKAAANGGLNLSIPDGWWAEGYEPDVGWAIGSGESYDDLEYQNEVESQALYDLLEKEVVPLFYDRGPDKLPRGWISKMKARHEPAWRPCSTPTAWSASTPSGSTPRPPRRWEQLTDNDLAEAREPGRLEALVPRATSTPSASRASTTTSPDTAGQVGTGHPRRGHHRHRRSSRPTTSSWSSTTGPLDEDGQLRTGEAIKMDSRRGLRQPPGPATPWTCPAPAAA